MITVRVTITETDRLIIHTWIAEEDADQAFQIYSDPEVTRFLITKVDSVESSLNLLQQWIAKATLWNNGTGLWALLPKKLDKLLERLSSSNYKMRMKI